MKFFTGCVLAAGLVLGAAAAQAQGQSPVQGQVQGQVAASDVGGPAPGPYAAMPPEAPRPGYGNGPTLLPPIEVYTVVRESGFSPLGVPHLRGFIYRIAVVDRSGADGRLVIDARDGRVLRLVRAHGIGGNFNDDSGASYAPPATSPPMTDIRGAPRPPRSVPHVASRTPVPKANPLAAKPAAGPEPEPAQQRSVAPPKAAEAQTPSPPAATTGAAPARPAPQIAPTQDMPVVQGLE
jgi:hypothetical protein